MSSTCELSRADSAFSTWLSAFVGSILTGLFSGFIIAFFTGMLAWVAWLRILVAGFYEIFLTFKAGLNFQDNNENGSYQGIHMVNVRDGAEIANDDESQSAPSRALLQDTSYTPNNDMHAQSASGYTAAQQKALNRFIKAPTRTVDIFGWLGWSWSAIYTPISHSIWLATNVANGRGVLLLVRALAIAVSALSLTFDCKQRYGAHLGRKWGSWAFVAFNVWTSTACLLLGIESAVLLIVAATRLDSVPIFVFIIYPVFSAAFTFGSWKVVPPMDASRPGVHIVVDVLVGAFSGLFVAAPAFILWRSAVFDRDADSMMGYSSSASEGLNLNEFLQCQGASFFEKFAAIMP